MSQPIGLVMFAGGERDTHPLLNDMQRLRQACARDALERAMAAQVYDPIIVATDDADWAGMLNDLPVSIDLDPTDRPFHFGRRLADTIELHHLQRVLYLGAASCPLLGVEQFRQIAAAACQHERAVIANNIHSTDWAAITPASIVTDWIDRLDHDNGLGWVLSNEAGLTPIAWPSSPATRLDIDVPIDAQIAALHPDCGPRLRRVVAELAWPDQRLVAAREVIRTRAARLTLIGRVPAWAWAHLEKSAQCWGRVYSEERGMRAAGRLGAGQVRSLLNEHLRGVGLQRCMADLCSMTDAILWDTRVLWAAQGVWPGEIDRYAADLGLVDTIEEPFIREFTQAVIDAPIPIVTGGHALVSGGLWTLLDSMQDSEVRSQNNRLHSGF
jgi:hypothetical protein